MSQPFLPLDLILEATRGMCEDCQKSFRKRVNKLIADEKPPTQRPEPEQEPEPAKKELPVAMGLSKLLREVASRHRIPVKLLADGGNQWRLVIARREFCRLARQQGHFLTDIGKAINRHYASVHHLIKSDTPERLEFIQ